MKSHKYIWREKIYVLHLGIRKGNKKSYNLKVRRKIKNGTDLIEIVKLCDINTRTIISKKRPEEEAIEFLYSDELEIEIFEVEDNAFYPLQPIFVG